MGHLPELCELLKDLIHTNPVSVRGTAGVRGFSARNRQTI